MPRFTWESMVSGEVNRPTLTTGLPVIFRTWAMRGTLHLIAPAHLRGLLALIGPIMIARAARRHRELDLDAATLSRSVDVITTRRVPRAFFHCDTGRACAPSLSRRSASEIG